MCCKELYQKWLAVENGWQLSHTAGGENNLHNFWVVSKTWELPLHKKWSFPLRISSVNATKSAGNWEFGHIYWRNPNWKT